MYALFFIFLITPTFKNKNRAVIGLIIALLFKAFEFLGGGIQLISYILPNEIWFVIGMCMSIFEFKNCLAKKNLIMPILSGIVFLLLSVLVYIRDIACDGLSFLLGLIACYSVIMTIEKAYEYKSQSVVFGVLAKYTMPIFLMHTLFAAPLRTALFKLEIQNAVIHVLLGILISFIGPMIAAVVMKKTKWLEFFLYPGKFIKI